MGNTYKIIIFSLFSLLLFTQAAFALTFTGFTDKFSYKINETINYTDQADQNLTSNITIYLLNSSGSQFNFTSRIPNATNFTTQLNATVPRSGEYFAKANFTFNNTYFESSSIVKISRAHSIVIAANKPAYSPGEAINFTVRTTAVNDIGVSDENVTVRLLYSTNDTVLSSKSGLTNSAGEYSGTFTAPNTIGSYRLTVNDWVATKIIDISAFDLVAFTGDSSGNIKTKFAVNDTVFIYMDLFDTNKTRYLGVDTISVQVIYPNGTQNKTVSFSWGGVNANRLNMSFVVPDTGVHNIKVTVASTSKSATLPVEIGIYELVGWLERNGTTTTNFFTNDSIDVKVKVFNISTGEAIKTTALNYPFKLTLLDSSFANFSSISNTTSVDANTGIRTFNFNAPTTTGLYYVRVELNQSNQSKIDLDMKVTNFLPVSTPVDQTYNFKNVFVGNKQTIRILTTLSNSTSTINVTNISVVYLKSGTGTDITSSVAFNTSIVDYLNGKAGLIEFSAPQSADLYFLKTLVNNNFATETRFFVKLYTACAQLEGYRWFISSNDDANLTVKVSEAQDVGLVDSIAGNSSDSTNTEGGTFSSVYGVHDCYATYKTTASGTSSAGNTTSNIRVSVTKVVNTLNGEDVTTKVGATNLPTNFTDDNGKITLRIPKPSGGWDGGTYVVELELRDKNNNTDKGFGGFQVKNLWINVWPQQVGGRWKWYFSPTENMIFDVNAYNSTGTWYYYGQNNGVGDNCYVIDVFYQGNGAEWFWPPKKIASSKYTWSCTNTSVPTNGSGNGRFTLTINHTTAFDSGYYMVKVKVNTTAGVGDSGDGWFGIKAYNVYVRTTSSNYYDSWYRGVTDNVTLDIDITYANSTRWDCYWQKCPSSELVTENLNITAKLIKYDEWKPKDYAKTKYQALFTNSTVGNVTTRSLTNFTNTSAAIVSATVSNATQTATHVMSSFASGNLSSDNTIANASRASAGSNVSTTIYISKSVRITLASIRIENVTPSSLTVNVSLNDSSTFYNAANGSSSTVTFVDNLNTSLTNCAADASGNCTIAFNVTLNGTGSLTLRNLSITYSVTQNLTGGSNSSVAITIPKSATINSAFIGVNVTSGNFVANLSLVDSFTRNNSAKIFNASNLNTTLNNVSFASGLTSALSSCTNIGGNCTLEFNITLNNSGTVTFSNLRISYNTTDIIQNTSSLSINTTSGNANLTLIPRGGTNSNSWETGYYSLAVTIEGPQGKETGSYWYEIRSFFVNTQTVKPTNFAQTTYSYTSGQNITVNVSATNKPSWLAGSSYNVALTNIPVNITAVRLSYWAPTSGGIWEMNQVPVTWALNRNTSTNEAIVNPTINGTSTINITPGSSLVAGNWYNLEITMTDSSGNNQTGWAGFQVKDFTFAARTRNWQYSFSNNENIDLDVAVCSSDSWWCDFSTNTYTGSNVDVTVTKLMKSDSWPYTEISTWTANTSKLNSTNNGKGGVRITPTSNLTGGYYSAELRATPTSGSAVTTNVWFKVESFKLTVSTLKWEYKMSENVSLRMTPSVAATLSDAYVSCGYWPDQTTYSISAGTLSANSTSLSAGDNIIMLTPAGGKKWVSGYCYAYITVTSGGESQQAYASFNMQAFTLFISQSKYSYLKNETVVLKVTSDSGQFFNISNITLEFYNYENGSYITLRPGEHFATNATGKAFRGNATINFNATDYGNWTFKGWYSGKLTAVDSNNSAISQQTWLYFDIKDVLYAYGYPVIKGTTDYYSYNASSEDISLLVYTYKYNTARTDWWPFDSTSGMNVTITSIEKQSCISWPCTYANVTGWSAATATSTSAGRAHLNITRSGGWSSGWHYVNVQLKDSTGETATLNKQMGFWVNA